MTKVGTCAPNDTMKIYQNNDKQHPTHTYFSPFLLLCTDYVNRQTILMFNIIFCIETNKHTKTNGDEEVCGRKKEHT